MDSIYIDKLKILTHIGVTEQERSSAQELHISVELYTDITSAASSDNVADTIDYEAVCESIKTLAQNERNTIERLAEDIAQNILDTYHPHAVKVSVRKYILKNTNGVCVTITRP